MAPPVGFEPTILISKTSALGQTKLRGNNNLTLQIFKEQVVLYQNQRFCQPLCCFKTTNKKPLELSLLRVLYLVFV